VLQYFISTHGARKGLADTALKTANSGYLTRRLVDVAQDCIIVDNDCGTERGITVAAVMDGGEVVSSLAERILGRTVQEDVVDPATGEVLLARASLVEEPDAERVEKAQVEQVKIRSVLTCDARSGVCGLCYGRDLARGTPVNVGEAVGVIAAQSIGEPGTQLTMRTFHIGGAAQRGAEQSAVEATTDGTVKVLNRQIVTNSQGAPVVMSRNCEIVIFDAAGRERARHRVPLRRPPDRRRGGAGRARPEAGRVGPLHPAHHHRAAGRVEFSDLIENITLGAGGRRHRPLVPRGRGVQGHGKSADLRPRLILRDERGNVVKRENGTEAIYFLTPGSILSVDQGAQVNAGDVIARLPRESSKTRDITGGLPRVAELFEARRPKDHAIISEIDGRVEFGKDYKAKRRIWWCPSQVGDERRPRASTWCRRASTSRCRRATT
jgi:DNA-directed RNA polymerase subunit beta'